MWNNDIHVDLALRDRAKPVSSQKLSWLINQCEMGYRKCYAWSDASGSYLEGIHECQATQHNLMQLFSATQLGHAQFREGPILPTGRERTEFIPELLHD